MDISSLVNLLISLVSGAAGGNIAGAAVPADKNLGTLGNTIAGLLGGGAGGYLLKLLGVLGTAGVTGATTATGAAPTGTEFDIGSLIANIAGSGVGGAILTAIIGWLKSGVKP